MQAPLAGLSEGRRLARGAEFLDAPNELDRVAKRFRKPRQGRLHSLAWGAGARRDQPQSASRLHPPGRPTSAICGCRTKRASTLNKRTGVPRLMLYAVATGVFGTITALRYARRSL